MVYKWLYACSEFLEVKAMPLMQLSLEETIIYKGSSRLLLGKKV